MPEPFTRGPKCHRLCGPRWHVFDCPHHPGATVTRHAYCSHCTGHDERQKED